MWRVLLCTACFIGSLSAQDKNDILWKFYQRSKFARQVRQSQPVSNLTSDASEEIPEGCSFDAISDSGRFNVSKCGFELNVYNQGVYSWKLGVGQTSNWLGGPPVDASNSSAGGYAFFETSYISDYPTPSNAPKAWLKSPKYKPTTADGKCLRFAYALKGSSAERLRISRVQFLPRTQNTIYKREIPMENILYPTIPTKPTITTHTTDSTTADVSVRVPLAWTPPRNIFAHDNPTQELLDEVWSSSDQTRGEWVVGHVTYSSPYEHGFVFEAVPNIKSSQFRGYVAVDNIELTDGPCEDECEFNAGFCNWVNAEDDDFDWSLSRGTSWTHTGPIRDQPSTSLPNNFGGYTYIDSHFPRHAGNKARLISPSVESSVPSCFIFWFHMYGEGIGKLRVLQTSESNSTEVWRVTDSGPRELWYRAQVTLFSPTPFKIALEATVGESGYGDIAVDSFRMERGACPSSPQGSSSQGPDCTFEDGICNWQVVNYAQGPSLLWTRVAGDVNGVLPGGHKQQSTGNAANSYMLFDTYRYAHRPGSRGYFTSPPLKASNETHCVSFWVYQASYVPNLSRIGSLEVVHYQTKENASSAGENIPSVIWRWDNHHEDQWVYSQASFTPTNGGVISFVGTRGNGIRGVIGVDDISVFKGSCETLPTSAVIRKGDCSFDLHLCGWTVDKVIQPPPTTTTTTTTESANITTQASSTSPTSSTEITTTTSTTTAPTTRMPVEALFGETSPPTTTTSTEAETTTTTASPSTTPSTTTTVQTTTSSSTTPPSTTTEALTASSLPGQTTVADATTTESTEGVANTEAIDNSSTPIPDLEASEVLVKTESNRTANQVVNAALAADAESDHVTALGSHNIIDVVSSDSGNGSKSIIISTVATLNERKRRAAKTAQKDSDWIGFNRKDYARIMNLDPHRHWNPEPSSSHSSLPYKARNNNGSGWTSLNHAPNTNAAPYVNNGRYAQAQQSAVKAAIQAFPPHQYQPIPSTPSLTNPLQLLQVQLYKQPNNNNKCDDNEGRREEPTDPYAKWHMSGRGAVLSNFRDHTSQIAEGGYAYFESYYGRPVKTQLWSPDLPANETFCLTFFFAAAYTNANTSLSVKRRLGEGELSEDVWKVTSGALEKSDIRYKTPWIPAQILLESSESPTQNVVLEGVSDSGGFAIDDIRFLDKESCTTLPPFAALQK